MWTSNWGEGPPTTSPSKTSVHIPDILSQHALTHTHTHARATLTTIFVGRRTTIAGAEKPQGAIAKQAYQIHKQAGPFLYYMLPLHVGAVGFHVAKGDPILRRMLWSV